MDEPHKGTTWGEEQARGMGRGYVITACNLHQANRPNREGALRWFKNAYPGMNAAEHKTFLEGFDQEMGGGPDDATHDR